MGEHLQRPLFKAWLDEGIAAGGLRPTAVENVRPFTDDDLNKFGIAATPAAGHTHGSTVYEVLGDDVLLTGDAFITDRMSYPEPVIGAIDPIFTTDEAAAVTVAVTMRRDLLILPGHGPALPPERSSPQPSLPLRAHTTPFGGRRYSSRPMDPRSGRSRR